MIRLPEYQVAPDRRQPPDLERGPHQAVRTLSLRHPRILKEVTENDVAYAQSKVIGQYRTSDTRRKSNLSPGFYMQNLADRDLHEWPWTPLIFFKNTLDSTKLGHYRGGVGRTELNSPTNIA